MFTDFKSKFIILQIVHFMIVMRCFDLLEKTSIFRTEIFNIVMITADQIKALAERRDALRRYL